MTEQTLFGSSGERPDVNCDEQWRLETLFLCNWGGFGGVTVVNMDHGSTLLSGASGAGKSTILDAYTALINPARPFNVASNEAGSRRNDGARTTLTYVRGQFDRTERDGILVPRVLRGANQDTWSALAAVFVATRGAHLTVLRLFFATQEAGSASDMTTLFIVFEGRLERRHLEGLEAIAPGGFRKNQVEKTLSGVRILNQSQYIEAVQAKLHIGTGGDGGMKALRLLHELQSGKPQPSVDALFKQMVLESPVTYEEADKAIKSFDKLDEGYREILEKERQHDVLKDIEGDHDRFTGAQAEIERIDTLRVTASERSPFLLWAHRRRAEAYAENILESEKAIEGARAEQKRYEGLKKVAELKLAEANERYLAGGGGTREEADRRISALAERRESIQRVRVRFENRIRSCISLPRSANEFAEAQRQAELFLGGFEAETARLRNAKIPLLDERGGIRNKKTEAEAELRHLEAQNSNIPSAMHAVRLQFAEVAGLTPSDLLFVGELLDMRPDYEGWRTAADAVLASLAYRLLVDERDLQTLRRAVNGIRTSVRLSFEGVPVGLPVHSVEDRSTLAGRLVIQNCQFAGWLSKHLDERHAYRCVQSVEDLADDGVHRVTREGQVQRGKSGAHGGNTQRRIGFTNDHRRAEVEADIKTFESQINVIEGKLDTIEAQENQLRQQKDAWVEVSTTTWADIDIAAIDASISEWKEVLAEIVIESPELDALAGQRINLKTEIDDTFEKAILAKNKVEQFEDEHETLTAQVEPLRQLIDALKSDDTIRLTDEQQVHLDTKANSFVDWDGRGATFGAVINSIRVEIGAELSGAQARMDAAANRLTSAFMLFHTQWPDPSRGTGLLSYDDYHGILADLCANGLAAQRQNWSRKVIEYSGDRLSVLNNSYGLAKDEIAERLGPVRRILRKVPFGSREGATLDIAVLHRRPESVSVFQRRLRKLAEGTMIPLMDDAAAEAKFASIREVLAVIRPKSPERDLLLDVRRHLKVTAQVLDGEGLAVAAYDHITDKSGGEAQMITAFICGAALRYQLGDEDREHPRFAPVVLDEAFIKADGRYTMLAVKAWQTLGFQLVIGAPEDKFNAIEPAVGLVIGVTKDREEHSYAIPAPRKPKINGA